jgi:hypothetical protein
MRAAYGWSLLLALASTGCNSLTVDRFSGTIIELTMAGATASPPGTHLELWARDQYDDVIRIVGANSDGNPPGLVIRPALSLADPCIIDDAGHLLTSPDAYPGPVTLAGVTQTPDEQAQQVKNRIAQVTGADQGGREPSSLLAVVPFDDTPLPTVAADATPDQRLAACDAYWSSPLAYTGNPAALLSPLHGVLYGFVAYSTTSPPAILDGIRIETPIALDNIQELWMTLESVPASQVDPVHRGPIYLRGTQTHGGAEVEHFDLTGDTASGTAVLEVDLNQDTVSF